MKKATKGLKGDKEKATIGLEEDEEKTKSVSIEIDHDGEETNPTSTPPMDAIAPVPPQSTVLITQ
ncbi:hypothetical protein J1N35_005383 [Gossypium stocksii]|uniref:Uncharacterized protein n=1 Tax=Gossypium stocksii TaxID=47602 RepID=A0A9D4AIX9_9ROSI|nr:hypothetical protein J1N35_005383 [Gossypium stocksii]